MGRFEAKNTKLLKGTQGYQATTTGLLYKSHSHLSHILTEWNERVFYESFLVEHYQIRFIYGRDWFLLNH